MANPSPPQPTIANVQRAPSNNPGLQNQIPPNIVGDCDCLLCATFGTHTDTLPNSSTSPPHRGHRTDRRCPTSAEILKGTKEYFLRRRLTSLTCHTPLTEVERRKMQEYYEECARVIGPDYWSPRFIDSVQGAAEKDKNTTLKSLL